MSFTNQSGDLSSYQQVLPGSLDHSKPVRVDAIAGRRRVKLQPQSGISYGSAGAGAGGAQVNFMVAGDGLIDLRSVVVSYIIQTSGNAVKGDGSIFMNRQALLNGTALETQSGNAVKYENVEMTMGSSRSFYETGASMMGFWELNGDLQTTLPSSVSVPSAWGCVAQNAPFEYTRQSRAAAAVFGGISGEAVSTPLGLLMAFARCKQYLPLSVLGNLQLNFICGTPAEVLYNTGSATTGDYSLSQVFLEFDMLTPSGPYQSVLRSLSNSPDGLTIMFEASQLHPVAAISSSSTLNESTLIISRAANNLTRAAVVQVPTSGSASINYPSQSSFSHAGVWSVQAKCGASVFPNQPAVGDASIFSMSMNGYGSVLQENGTTTSRVLWGNSTAATGTLAAPVVYETADAASSGTTKFAYADRFIPTWSFKQIQGAAESDDIVQGLDMASQSGSQLILSVVSAPAVSYTPVVITHGLRFIKAADGMTQIIGV